MNERELKKLSRVELLEMLLDLSKENEGLTAQVEALRRDLEDRRIDLEKAGSIANAALALNGIFEAAQAAADQYLVSVRAKAEENGPVPVEAEYEAQAQRMLEETQAKCDAMLAEAQEQIDRRWQRLLEQIDALHLSSPELEELLRGAKAPEGEEVSG